jgi:ubiquinone/menaquinone biosynthesis C-methylase UbiE
MRTHTTSTTKTSATGSRRKISAFDFHEALIKEKGVRAASGFSARSRQVRFDVIHRLLVAFDLFSEGGIKLLDYGCNDGELYKTLKGSVEYVGMDINRKLIKWARERWRETGAKFMVGNALEDTTFDKIIRLKPDVIVASGVLSYSGDAHNYPELLDRLFTAAKRGVIFNVLSIDVPKNLIVPTQGMIRWQPAKLLRLIQACGCNSWELIRSYLHNDITVVMRKNWTHYESGDSPT